MALEPGDQTMLLLETRRLETCHFLEVPSDVVQMQSLGIIQSELVNDVEESSILGFVVHDILGGDVVYVMLCLIIHLQITCLKRMLENLRKFLVFTRHVHDVLSLCLV